MTAVRATKVRGLEAQKKMVASQRMGAMVPLPSALADAMDGSLTKSRCGQTERRNEKARRAA